MAAGVMPKVYDLAMDKLQEKDDLKPRAAMTKAGSGGVFRSGGAPGAPAPMATEGAEVRSLAMDMSSMLEYGAPAAAHGEEGELFRYELDAPVTIQRQRSAMLPILNTPVESRRVSIFNPADGQAHPMRGLEITNNTSNQLMPGPVSVFEGGAYAGDAQIGHIPAGDKRLLAYATDIEVGVTTNQKMESAVRKVKIVKGVIEQTLKYVNTVEYTFVNKDLTKGRTLLVEQPRLSGYELVGISPSETTQALYRFEVTLDAGKAGTLKIPQEMTGSTTLAITDAETRVLLEYCTNGKASEAVVNAIREVGKRRDALQVAQRKVENLQASWNEIDKDQGRLRQNMNQLDRASDLYSQYMQKLTAQEKKIDQLDSELQKARGEVQSAERELNTFIASLNVE